MQHTIYISDVYSYILFGIIGIKNDIILSITHWLLVNILTKILFLNNYNINNENAER